MTLKEYIRLHKAEIDPEQLLEQYLTAARKHRQSIRGLELAKALPEKEEGWLALVGLGAPTRVRIAARKEAGETRWFGFLDPVNDWADDHTSRLTGDGTVPFDGAVAHFLKMENLACVSPDEFGTWEFQDRLVARKAGFHAALPTVNLVQRLTTKFLRPAYSGDVKARAAPGVSKPAWPMELKPI